MKTTTDEQGTTMRSSVKVSFVMLLSLAALSMSVAAGCSSSEESGEDEALQDDGALIGGDPATVERFPSTVYMKQGCTAAKVAPKRLLTAAHCVLDPATMSIRLSMCTGPGTKLALTREPVKGFVEHEVAAVNVHPAWLKACEDTYCAASSVTALLDAPDVAVIELVDDLEDVPVARIEPAALSPGDRVLVLGFGCTEGVLVTRQNTTPTLSFAKSKITAPSRAVHDGSPVTNDDVAKVSGNYAMTLGPGAVSSKAGLCPGDSGGPMYRQRGSSLTVVGVNANYTFKPDSVDQVGLPVTNWHTRLDDASRNGVGAWLRSVGVTVE